MTVDSRLKKSAWAELLEAQTMTLSSPKTGQVVIMDIGEANDINPRNKQDVVCVWLLMHLIKIMEKQILFFQDHCTNQWKCRKTKLLFHSIL